MDKYEHEGVVGEGSYGVVLKCKQKDTGRIVAIKKFLETDEDQAVKKIAMREIRMLKRLRHENLINLIEVFRRRRKLFLVFEYVDHTVLKELEENSNGLHPDKARSHVFQVLRGIDFCHQNNIIHRDVKPENVLVSSLGIVKLCDFGFARLMAAPGEAYTDYVATRWYRAPELLVGDNKYGKEVDIWAVGCLYAEMRSGDPLFPGESDIDQLYLITKTLGSLCARHRQLIAKNPMFNGMNIQNQNPKGLNNVFPNWSTDALQLLSLSLQLDPNQRPSASSLLETSFFSHDNFNIVFPMQIKAKIQQEFHPSPGHEGHHQHHSTDLPLSNLINTEHRKSLSEKRQQDMDNASQSIAKNTKKDLLYRRKSETFDALLGTANLVSQAPSSGGGGTGNQKPQAQAPLVLGGNNSTVQAGRTTTNMQPSGLIIGPKSKTFIASSKPTTLSSNFSAAAASQDDRFPSAISETSSVSTISPGSEKMAGSNSSPGKLRRFDGYEQDLNKLVKSAKGISHAMSSGYISNNNNNPSQATSSSSQGSGKRKNNQQAPIEPVLPFDKNYETAFFQENPKAKLTDSQLSTMERFFAGEPELPFRGVANPFLLKTASTGSNSVAGPGAAATAAAAAASSNNKLLQQKKRRQTEPPPLSLPSVTSGTSRQQLHLESGRNSRPSSHNLPYV